MYFATTDGVKRIVYSTCRHPMVWCKYVGTYVHVYVCTPQKSYLSLFSKQCILHHIVGFHRSEVTTRLLKTDGSSSLLLNIIIWPHAWCRVGPQGCMSCGRNGWVAVWWRPWIEACFRERSTSNSVGWRNAGSRGLKVKVTVRVEITTRTSTVWSSRSRPWGNWS